MIGTQVSRFSLLFAAVCSGMAAALFAIPQAAQADGLHVVGVLCNSSGMNDRPIPFAYYTGIAADASGRLFLAGAAEGFVVCDQDGRNLAIVPLANAERMTLRSVLVRAGSWLFAVATDPGQSRSALYGVDTTETDARKLAAVRIAVGPGHWSLSPTLDRQGRRDPRPLGGRQAGLLGRGGRARQPVGRARCSASTNLRGLSSPGGIWSKSIPRVR